MKREFTILKLRKSVDGEGRKSLVIEIDDRGVFVPTEIISEFIDSDRQSIVVSIPND